MTPKQFLKMQHDLGVSRKSLAVILDVGIQHIDRWIKGTDKISAEMHRGFLLKIKDREARMKELNDSN